MTHQRSLSWLGFAAALSFPSLALAAPDGGAPDGGLGPAEVIAQYCSPLDYECTTAPLSYAKTIELPVAFDWDTGWIPSGSNIQVRFYVKLPAQTTVELDGSFETTWPEPMTLATPGGGRGFLSFDYGLEVGAQAKVDLTVAGVGIKWQGDIPFVPKVDFKMAGETLFDSWAFEPNGVSASGLSPKLRLFEVNVLSLAGIPSQISKGGVALDVKGELEATYQTERMRIEPAKATDSNIETENGTTTRDFAGGAFVEYDVFPEGRVDYVGTLHLIPSFFLSVLGKDFSIPIVDVPASLKIGSQDFIFDPVRVHVPLPDIEPMPIELDFGAVEVGKSKKLSVDISNIGEAKARAVAFIDSKMASTFGALPPEVYVDSMQKQMANVVFEPQATGPVETVLTYVTNDPDTRFQKITLRGTGVGPGQAPDGGTDGVIPSPDDSGDAAGCGCRTPAPQRDAPGGGWVALAGALWLVRRRRS